MVKFRKYLVLSLLSIFFLSAYTIPSDSKYIIVNCRLGNNIRINFADNLVQYLSVEGNNVINRYSGNVYGFTSNTMIYFPLFDEPYYRDGYNTSNLSITRIVENHLDDGKFVELNTNYQSLVVAIAGGLLLCSFLRLFKSHS